MITLRRFARHRSTAAAFDPPTLYRFVLLSMLLHVLVLLVFGTAPGGGARRQGGSWGSLDVTLRPLSPEPGAGFRLAPGADTPTPAAALLQRLGGATRAPPRTQPAKAPTSPPPATPPAAATPGEPPALASPPPTRAIPAATSTPGATDREPVAPLSPPAETVPVAPEAAPPVQSTPFQALPQFNRNAPEVVDKPLAPSAPPAPRVERKASPPLESPPRELPASPVPPPAEPIAPPKIERDIVQPVAPTPRELPMPPTPVPEPIAPPKIERDVVQPVESPAPRRVPAESAPLPERSAPAIERESAAPPTPLPRSAPAQTAPRAERVAPSAPAAESAPVAQPPARTAVPSDDGAPPLRFGAPDPGAEDFKPRRDVVVPSAEPGGAPRIDLEASRQRAREIASETSGYRGVVPLALPPLPPERKTKLGEAIEKAVKPDCRDAYAGLGLLAVPALIASTVGNGGCRW